MLSKALKNVIEAQGGIDKLSVQVKEVYDKLEQILAEKEERNRILLSECFAGCIRVAFGGNS
ncbi:hypothetical protein [Nostoc sp.]|uniref:hypothetical protein n=1 Tax=Nostoc sp. TaxID=1180 RepID=UPI002FF8E445